MDNILKERRLEKKLTLEEVGEKVGVGKSTVRKWENGMIENMGRDKIVLLSKALDISPLEILGIEDELSPSSIETIYNQLNEPRQTKVYNYAERQLEEQNSKVTSTDKNKTVYILGKTAANPTELSYGDAVYDETIDTNVPRNADCALVIQGDSMEPLLKDGSIVFYKSQPDVETGEIAIVEIDGEGVTCKKYYANYDENIVTLKSLNDKYEARELSPDKVRIIGKVVL